MSKKMKRIFIAFCTIALVFSTATTAFATDDPLQVVNNLSEFIFGLIRAIGGEERISCGSGAMEMIAFVGVLTGTLMAAFLRSE